MSSVYWNLIFARSRVGNIQNFLYVKSIISFVAHVKINENKVDTEKNINL